MSGEILTILQSLKREQQQLDFGSSSKDLLKPSHGGSGCVFVKSAPRQGGQVLKQKQLFDRIDPWWPGKPLGKQQALLNKPGPERT